jgi:hypothetical protein
MGLRIDNTDALLDNETPGDTAPRERGPFSWELFFISFSSVAMAIVAIFAMVKVFGKKFKLKKRIRVPRFNFNFRTKKL